ncbi:MAG: LURP-one-related family protein [Burkholderiales bacterium]|nr:LURP-one-related family protein [Burkholderiales bacterium]
MYFRMRKKFFSFSDTYEIRNEKDELAFVAKTDTFSWLNRTTLYDANEREILTITRHSSFIFSPTYEVEFANGRRVKIEHKFSFFTKSFVISGEGQAEMVAEGDFFEYEYRINHAELGEVASISKGFAIYDHSYGVYVKNDEFFGEALACNLIIEFEVHAEEKDRKEEREEERRRNRAGNTDDDTPIWNRANRDENENAAKSGSVIGALGAMIFDQKFGDDDSDSDSSSSSDSDASDSSSSDDDE